MNTPRLPTLSALLTAYCTGTQTVTTTINTLQAALAANPDPAIWINTVPAADLYARAEFLDAERLRLGDAVFAQYPLFGLPFAIKDNLDLAGLPTTCACPDYAYTPTRSATVVERLLAAGAVAVGKTNLDQFATGLVGVRSPYGAVKNPFDDRYIAGGSSSGSAAALARGQVVFALGTDTAGSGRIPAGCCELVGLKPSRGLLSTRGLVPACRTLDCVSIFAHSVADAWQVFSVAAGPDADDPYSRTLPQPGPAAQPLRVGLPQPLTVFEPALAAAFDAALSLLAAHPAIASITPVDFAPFQAAASLLYNGPWVAERRQALGEFFSRGPLDPTVQTVIAKADQYSAVDVFAGLYRLEELRRIAEKVFADIDVLLVPTLPLHPTLAAVQAEPIALNSQLGTYTNFVNLLDLCALALPTPRRADGLPSGITLIAPAGHDHRLAEFARRLEPTLSGQTTTAPLPPLPFTEPTVPLAVVGAHLSGLPLNYQLVERGARLRRVTHTAPHYRLYALPGTIPPKPGLLRVAADGVAIAVEIWELPLRRYGDFVAAIPAPLGIGTLELSDGSTVQGFLCETAALSGATDISAHGGWRAYLAACG